MKQAATILQETSCELCITNDSEPAGMVCLKLDLGGPKKKKKGNGYLIGLLSLLAQNGINSWFSVLSVKLLSHRDHF